MKSKKTESIKEFLERGGSITKVPAKVLTPKDYTHHPSAQGPAVILTLEDADLFYGEAKKSNKTKAKPRARIDLSALPEALRAKYVARAMEEAGLDEEDFKKEK